MSSEEYSDPLVGAVLQQRYRIVEHIADGAMGAVYRGERLGLRKPVAVKFLHESFVDETQFLQRFEREARAMSRLSHPHCVSVTDFGVAESPYIVMDFVTGQTLRELVDDVGRLEPTRALDIVAQVLAGVAHAHGCGIIHRDIKPANVVLTEATGFGDFVRLLDFGLAKLRDPHVRGDPSTSFVVVGTPNYMSPEQSRLETVDERADVYSTGIVLFELLTGQKPFLADSTSEILRMQREEPLPRLGDMVPGMEFSRQLEDLVRRAAAKDPNMRFSSAIDFADALREVPEAQTQSSRTSRALTPPVTANTANLPAIGGAAAGKPPPIPKNSRSGLTDNEASELVGRHELADSDLTFTNVVLLQERSRWATVLYALVALLVLGGGAYAMYGTPGATNGGDEPAVANGALVQTETDSDAPPDTLADAPPVPELDPEPADEAEPEAERDAERAAESEADTPEQALVPVEDGAIGEPSDAVGALADAPDEGANELAGEAAAEGPPGEAAVAAFASADDGVVDDPEALEAEAAADDEPIAFDEVDFAPDELGEPVEAVGPEADAVGDQSPARPEPIKPATVAVNTVADATRLIQAGQREQALRGLQALQRKNPRSAYIPYLIGNLYFDKKYWTDGLKAYEQAIRVDGKYRSRRILTDNAIRALSSNRTKGRASRLLAKSVGRPALPRLRTAAKKDKNPSVRRRASRLAAQIAKSTRPASKRRVSSARRGSKKVVRSSRKAKRSRTARSRAKKVRGKRKTRSKAKARSSRKKRARSNKKRRRR